MNKKVIDISKVLWDYVDKNLDTNSNIDTYRIAIFVANEKQLTAIECNNFDVADFYRQVEDEIGNIYKSTQRNGK